MNSKKQTICFKIIINSVNSNKAIFKFELEGNVSFILLRLIKHSLQNAFSDFMKFKIKAFIT